MTEELITWPTAKLAKEKGFDLETRDCFEWYIYEGKEYGPYVVDPITPEWLAHLPKESREAIVNRPGLFLNSRKEGFLAQWLWRRPTQDLLARWLREVHGLSVGVYEYEDQTWQWIIQKMHTQIEHSVLPEDITGKPGSSPTHELAREAALYHALTLLS
jgi:hypothetical protein